MWLATFKVGSGALGEHARFRIFRLIGHTYAGLLTGVRPGVLGKFPIPKMMLFQGHRVMHRTEEGETKATVRFTNSLWPGGRIVMAEHEPVIQAHLHWEKARGTKVSQGIGTLCGELREPLQLISSRKPRKRARASPCKTEGVEITPKEDDGGVWFSPFSFRRKARK